MSDGFKIEAIYAYVAVDPEDGDEGIMAFKSQYGPMPMIAADMTRLEELRPIAEATAKALNIEVRLLRFDTRRTVEILNEGAQKDETDKCPECNSTHRGKKLWPCDDGPNAWHEGADNE